jgi:hypothetical protein
MILNRGLFASLLVSRVVGIPFGRYVLSVYARPALALLPVLGLALWLRSTILPGNSWLQIFAAGAILGVSYYGIAFFIALDRPHRSMLIEWLRGRWIRVMESRLANR